jgi:endonuclease/exonuclease/phosphatase family metal-dependent hydrolase
MECGDMSQFARKRTIVWTSIRLVAGLALVAVLLRYFELRWMTTYYTVSSIATSTMESSVNAEMAIRSVFLNTHLLPRGIERVSGSRSDGLYRAQCIAKALASYDIIGLCEAFDPKCQRALVDSLQELSRNAFHVVSSPKPPRSYLLSGGCLLLTKYPIESIEAITFSSTSTFWSHGIFADGFAAKGAILARIRLPGPRESGTLLNCVVTHLEARSKDCREKQIDELADFLHRYAGGNPTILMGDLNTSAEDEEEYARLRDALQIDGASLRDAWAELGVSDGGTSDPLTHDGGDRIDYILYAPGTGERRIRLTDVSVRPLRDKRVGSLSDHAAVEGTFEVSNLETKN